MPHVQRSILVPYSPARMYELVRDVERYPQFLPWCAGSRVQPGPQAGTVDASIDLAYLGVRSHFKTRNTQREPDLIRIRLLEGPFRDLEGEWTFAPLGEDASKVSLDLRYSFASGVLGRVVAPVFDRIAGSLIDAFSHRAEDLYGPGV